MSNAKRRKVSAASSRSSTSSTKGIAAFAKVSKAHVLSKNRDDKTGGLELSLVSQSNGKRKHLIVEEVDTSATSVDQASATRSAVQCQSERKTKALPQRTFAAAQKPFRTPIKPDTIPATPTSQETPTKGALERLDGLTLLYSSPVEPEYVTNTLEQLPSELHDLINLHASFLTALALHHAHNGTRAPADLRLLCPDVARAWGKRTVMLEDIQRVLGVVNTSKFGSGLTLSDYGHGKICVERTSSEIIDRVAGPLNENRINGAFEQQIRKLWKNRDQTVDTVSIFMRTLPFESITICSSLTKMSPLLLKGQRRLEDLRAGIVLKKQADKEKAFVSANEDGSRKPTLLERLKMKQLHQSTLPPPPSKAEVGRKAALHRLEEVVSVLTVLTTSTSIGQARVSFTMPTVLGKLKDSFKTPVSREEGATCVRLLASEVAPEWLRVVRIGKVDAVVVNRENRPSDLDIKERVKRAS